MDHSHTVLGDAYHQVSSPFFSRLNWDTRHIIYGYLDPLPYSRGEHTFSGLVLSCKLARDEVQFSCKQSILATNEIIRRSQQQIWSRTEIGLVQLPSMNQARACFISPLTIIFTQDVSSPATWFKKTLDITTPYLLAIFRGTVYNVELHLRFKSLDKWALLDMQYDLKKLMHPHMTDIVSSCELFQSVAGTEGRMSDKDGACFFKMDARRLQDLGDFNWAEDIEEEGYADIKDPTLIKIEITWDQRIRPNGEQFIRSWSSPHPQYDRNVTAQYIGTAYYALLFAVAPKGPRPHGEHIMRLLELFGQVEPRKKPRRVSWQGISGT